MKFNIICTALLLMAFNLYGENNFISYQIWKPDDWERADARQILILDDYPETPIVAGGR